ncbi:MAG: cell wall-binding repeat-containing protein [Actinomycetota bacterium]|nr:cell wall-binding repeat-containing protein [Actinomycetota bacterium]
MSGSLRARLAVLLAFALIVALVPAVSIAGDVDAQALWEADAYEFDNTTATAQVLPAVSYHTFHADDDDDYFKISTDTTGTPFLFEIVTGDGEDQDSDPWFYVFDADGNGVDNNDDHYFNTYASAMVFVAPEPGTYYVAVKPRNSEDRGSYWLYWNQGFARRISGATRYDTARNISNVMFSDALNAGQDEGGPGYAVVASGVSFADALAGGVLASFDDASLLLTSPTALSPECSQEIDRLFKYNSVVNDTKGIVYGLGGSLAVSDAVVDAIEALPYVEEVIRLSGTTRYATAAAIMEQGEADYGFEGDTAFIVSGTAWPDALAAGPVAAWNASPLLMVGESSIPASTTAALTEFGIKNIVVVGGEMVIAPSVYDALESFVGTGTITRVAGTTRYETSRKIAQWGVDNIVDGPPWDPMSGDGLVLASGANFPDGLAAGPICWWGYNPLLLTPADSLSAEVKKYIDENGAMTEVSYVVGGSLAVSDATLAELNAHVNIDDYLDWLDK